jgi:hypothetical protein
MIKLKKLLKEGLAWERNFGEKLPTLADVKKNYNNKKKITEDVSTTQGILAELERILVAWEDNVYPDDKTRWNDYYHDIEQLVTKIKK